MTEHEEEEVLFDGPLVPDPDAGRELGPDDPEPITDEEVKGSRLLVVREGIAGTEHEGRPYGVVRLGCVFQPAPGARYSWARVSLRFDTPPGVRVLALTPRLAREGDPVRITRTSKTRLGLREPRLGVESATRVEYSVHHCSVQGSGVSTPNAWWDFRENQHTRAGIDPEQALELTLPGWGPVGGTLTASARLVRPGFAGGLERARDLVLGGGTRERSYPVSFDIPPPEIRGRPVPASD